MAPTLALAALPADCLLVIASHLDDSRVVVALGSSRDGRAALRAGVDEAERTRFGLTVSEARSALTTNWLLLSPKMSYAYAVTDPLLGRPYGTAPVTRRNNCHVAITGALASRHAAGLAMVCAAENEEFNSGVIPILLAYGATPDAQEPDWDEDGTALHYTSRSGHDRSLELATLLLDNGARIDAESENDDLSGTTALAWALADNRYDRDLDDEETWLLGEELPSVLNRLRVAKLLLERGADIGFANDGFKSRHDSRCDCYGREMAETLDDALWNLESYVSHIFELTVQRWDEVEDDVRRAHLSVMPECTAELSELFFFVVDRVEASIEAANAANAASRAAAKVAIAAARRAEKRRAARAKELAEAYAKGFKNGHREGRCEAASNGSDVKAAPAGAIRDDAALRAAATKEDPPLRTDRSEPGEPKNHLASLNESLRTIARANRNIGRIDGRREGRAEGLAEGRRESRRYRRGLLAAGLAALYQCLVIIGVSWQHGVNPLRIMMPALSQVGLFLVVTVASFIFILLLKYDDDVAFYTKTAAAPAEDEPEPAAPLISSGEWVPRTVNGTGHTVLIYRDI